MTTSDPCSIAKVCVAMCYTCVIDIPRANANATTLDVFFSFR